LQPRFQCLKFGPRRFQVGFQTVELTLQTLFLVNYPFDTGSQTIDVN